MSAKLSCLRRYGVWVLVAAIALAAPLALAEDRRPAANNPQRRGVGLRLDSARLAPSVSVELEALATFREVVGLGDRQPDHMLMEQFTDTVERGATRVTRRAVKNFLLDALQIDRGIERMKTGVGADSVGGDRMDFNFGVHSGLPELGLRYRLSQGSMRLRVGMEGEMGVHFRLNGAEQSDFGVYFDGSDEVTLRARLSF